MQLSITFRLQLCGVHGDVIPISAGNFGRKIRMKGYPYSPSAAWGSIIANNSTYIQVQYASFHPRTSDINNIPDILRSDATSEFAHSKLAELQILDSMTFDEVLSRCLEGEIKTRLCQNFLLQFLLRNCQQILDQPDMKAMRRATITLWKLI